MHGGRTPRGLANPNTRSGRYSRDMPTRLYARYEVALTDPELTSVRKDVALLHSMIDDRLAAWAEQQADPDWSITLDQVEKITKHWKTWDWTTMERELGLLADTVSQRRSEADVIFEIRTLIDQRAKLAAQEHRRMLDLNQVLTVEQVVTLARTLATIVNRYLPDEETKNAINAEFSKVMSTHRRGEVIDFPK